jgi:predicted XRE-type DNA-binding protein
MAMTKAPTTDLNDDDFIIGSGDYLKDRGYADPEEGRTKFFLSHEIAVLVENMGLSQRAAAARADMKQPDISRIINGNVRDFSVWRLLKVLSALGRDIRIGIEPSLRESGTITAFNVEDETAQPKAMGM